MTYGNGGTVQAIQGGALGQMEGFNPTAAAIEKTPVIARNIERTHKAAEVLHQTIDRLTQKLEPVCTPTQPATQGQGTATPTPLQSAVASTLDAQGYRIDAATQRLIELINRIEL